uniref:Uncharacterized protein n=1 Tax=Sus scrofa TaxID=9823 RepID=A0A480IF45_PIG
MWIMSWGKEGRAVRQSHLWARKEQWRQVLDKPLRRLPKAKGGVPVVAQWLSGLTNPTSIHEDEGLIPDLAQCIAVSCGVGCRCSSDPKLLWLWRRLAATVLIHPLSWEPPYAAGVVLKRQKDQKKKMWYIYIREYYSPIKKKRAK